MSDLIISNSLPKGWKWVKLGDVVQINPRIPNKESISDSLEVQFLPMKLVEEVIGKIHLTEFRRYSEVQKSYTSFIDGDVIFAKVTPCMENGKIAVVENLKNGMGFGSSEFHVVRPSGSVNNKFLFNYLVQSRFRNEAQNQMTGAVGLRRVPKLFLENYQLPLPPLQIQHAIVSKIEELLSELDRGKQQLETAQQQLKVYRQAVLKWAFEGKFTNKDVKEGELPEGWKWVTPVQIASDEKYSIGIGPFGSNLKVSDYKFSGIPLIFVKNITRKDFSLAPRFISIDKFEELKAHSAKPLDILITKMGDPPGDCIIYPTNSPEAIITSDCLKFRINEEIANRRFVYYSLQTQSVKKQFGLITKGVAQKKISAQRFRNIQLTLPSLKEQQLIVDELESKLTVCDKVEETINQSLSQAETLRQSILKKAFEGKLVTMAAAQPDVSSHAKSKQKHSSGGAA